MDLRRINLIECLKEDAAAAGTPRGDPPDGSDAWSEPTLHAFYGAAPWPAPSPATFAAWFPAAARARPAAPPPALVIAFACAGSAEDMYTSEGTGPRRAPSPLLAWTAASGARLLAAQLPGRALRRGEAAPASAQAVAAAVLPLVAPLIVGQEGSPPTPYTIIGHSLGAWLAFELAAAAAAAGLPAPARLVVSAMPAPSLPVAHRPWRQQAGLDGEALKAECRAWGISDAVFEPGVWATYETVLRSDFRLFDEYVWRAPPLLTCPITAYYGDADTRVSADLVRGWAGVTAAPTRVARARGPHLWPLQPGMKGEWLDGLVAEVRAAVGL